MKKIITISRQFGAGGGTIGEMVADRLGYEYYDKAVILRASREYGIDFTDFQLMEEKTPHVLGLSHQLFDFYNRPLNDQLFEAQKKIIRKYGDKGNCVIVGRNAGSVLREYDDSLHIFICADPSFRLENLRKRMPGASDGEIIDKMRSVDKKRKKYAAYYTEIDFGKAEDYDLCLNVSKLGVDKCVEIICELAR